MRKKLENGGKPKFEVRGVEVGEFRESRRGKVWEKEV